MKIVIDIGCARYGGDYSIERLIEEFEPDLLYGFDPNWSADMFDPPDDLKTSIVVSNEIAWTYDGTIGFHTDGLNSWVTELRGAEERPCFDLSDFIIGQYKITYDRVDGDFERDETEIILKIDAEGSEYDLLRHLINKGSDKLLSLAWVEWHQPDRGREQIEREIRCEITEWRW